MRKSRLSQVKQDRLIEHFVACTTGRCGESPGIRAIEAWWQGLHEDHSRRPVRYLDGDHCAEG